MDSPMILKSFIVTGILGFTLLLIYFWMVAIVALKKELLQIKYVVMPETLKKDLETIIQHKMRVLKTLPVGIMITKTEMKAGSKCSAHQILRIEKWLKHHHRIKLPSKIQDILGGDGYVLIDTHHVHLYNKNNLFFSLSKTCTPKKNHFG